MPDLISTYARSTGLLIDEPWMKEDFWPLPFDSYITLGTGSGQAAKCYDYYQEVLNILAPFLASANIAVVLLGVKEDPALQGVHDLRGKTSLHQSYYLVKRAKLALGNDSWMSHAAGAVKTPLVSLYGSTDKVIHGPHWQGPVKLLESHRRGNKPSFSNENPKTVNLIDPYVVAQAVLDLLQLNQSLPQRTIHMGGGYNQQVLEWIPNVLVNPQFNGHLPLAVRYDIVQNEQLLLQTLQSGRKVNIVTKSEINPQILAGFKQSILTYNHEVDETVSLDYVKAVRKINPAALFFTREKDLAKVAAIRFRLFDITTVQHVTDKTRDDFVTAARDYLNDPNFTLDTGDKFPRLEFKTNKYVLSNGKIYLSLAHERAGLDKDAAGGNVVLDDDWFFHDQNQMMVYRT